MKSAVNPLSRTSPAALVLTTNAHHRALGLVGHSGEDWTGSTQERIGRDRSHGSPINQGA